MKMNGIRFGRMIRHLMLIYALYLTLSTVMAQEANTYGIDIDKGAGGIYKKGEIVNINWSVQDPIESITLKVRDVNGIEFITKNFPGGAPDSITKGYELNIAEDHPNKTRSPIGTYKIDLEENYKKSDSGEIYQKRYGLDFFYAEAIGFLSITKFNDENGDGIKQSSEIGLPNWKFEIFGPNGFVRKLSTNENGELLKENVPAGDYVIREATEFGWENTTPSEQKTEVYDRKITFISFGNREIKGNLTIIKYFDENQNGIRDRNEKGLADWEFSITGESVKKAIIVFNITNLTYHKGI